MILALDISSISTGFAVMQTDKSLPDIVSVGVLPTLDDTHGARLCQFMDSLDNLFAQHAITEIVIEQAWAGRNQKTFKVLSYYHAIAIAATHKHLDKEPLFFMPSQIRKILGGKYDVHLNFAERELAKQAVMDLVNNLYKLNYTYDQNDQSDAIAIGLCYGVWEKFLAAAIAEVKTDNPRLKANTSILKKALKRVDYQIKKLIEENEKSIPNTRGRSKRKPRRSKKDI